MNYLEDRRDYFNFFSQFQSPYLNLTWDFEVEDFTKNCKDNGIPRFQWIIYNLCRSLIKIEAFMWRLDSRGEPVQIQSLAPSYTVLNSSKKFNFTSFQFDQSWDVFLQRSLQSKKDAESSTKLLVDETGKIDYIFITSLPWLRFTSIQHPIFDSKRVHIPSFAIGAFEQKDGNLKFPFSVQAHHGFVDGYHLHLLDQIFKKNLCDFSSVDL